MYPIPCLYFLVYVLPPILLHSPYISFTLCTCSIIYSTSYSTQLWSFVFTKHFILHSLSPILKQSQWGGIISYFIFLSNPQLYIISQFIINLYARVQRSSQNNIYPNYLVDYEWKPLRSLHIRIEFGCTRSCTSKLERWCVKNINCWTNIFIKTWQYKNTIVTRLQFHSGDTGNLDHQCAKLVCHNDNESMHLEFWNTCEFKWIVTQIHKLKSSILFILLHQDCF